MRMAFVVAVTEWLYSNKFSIKVGGFNGDILTTAITYLKKRNNFAISACFTSSLAI
jgi:cobalamin synthase